MTKITNLSNAPMMIARQKVKPGGHVVVEGRIPRSLRLIAAGGAIKIDGDSESDGRMQASSVSNPKDKAPEKTNDEKTAETERKIIEVMKSLPDDALMADGRPEVRHINDKLSEMGVNNITAADRDRLWAVAVSEE